MSIHEMKRKTEEMVLCSDCNGAGVRDNGKYFDVCLVCDGSRVLIKKTVTSYVNVGVAADEKAEGS